MNKMKSKVGDGTKLEEGSDFKSLVYLQAAHSDASNRLEALQAEVNANFLNLMDDAKTTFAQLQELIADAEDAMEVLARTHPEWFKQKKSVKTPYGTVKFHSSKVLEVKNEEATIILIEQDINTEVSRLKSEQEAGHKVDRSIINFLTRLLKPVTALRLETLEQCTDETLARYRVARVAKENFSVVPAKVDMGKAVKKADGAAEELIA